METNVVITADTIQASSAEIEDLVAEYNLHTRDAAKDQPPFDWDWETFTRLEQLGRTLLITARTGDDRYLIGYSLYLLSHHPHHRSWRLAMNDGIAVRHDYRGRGLGSAMMIVGEQLLREMHVHRIIHMFRMVYEDATPIFPRHGYKLFELAWAKDLSPQIQEK